MKSRKLLLLPMLLPLVACGGSSSGTASDTAGLSESTSAPANAVAMAVATSEAGGDVGHMSTAFEVTAIPQVKSINQVLNDGKMSFTIADHEMAEQNGTGTFVVNGTSVLDAKGEASLLNANGDLDVQLKDVTKTVDVSGTTYTATINGKLKITFSGTELPADIKESQIYTDINYTITGSNLAVTGTASGTIVSLNAVRNMKVMVVDGVAKRVSACSGTATIKTDEGTATCTYQANCSKCS